MPESAATTTVTNLSPAELGNAMQARRRRVTKTCAWCGKQFAGLAKPRNPDAEPSCSTTCRVQLWDRAHPERAKERHRKARAARAAQASALVPH